LETQMASENVENKAAPPGAHVTLNPELFDSPEHYSYRDLQRLCCRLKLGGRGKRTELVKIMNPCSVLYNLLSTVRCNVRIISVFTR